MADTESTAATPGVDIDLRLTQLSYSSLLTLHSCPRKFQLSKLSAKENLPAAGDTSSLTFAYGHAVGTGLQDVLLGKTKQQIYFEMFLSWNVDLAEENIKQNKSFWLAMIAIERFISMREMGFLQDYELLTYNGRPAVELGFRIIFPDGFMFRGFVDAVLRHKVTGKIVVLENKTSSSTNLNNATFKNSAQAVGYSVVLSTLFPELTEYSVIYLIYLTKNLEYETLIFEKSLKQRALWIRELLLDVETIKLYNGSGVFPMRGESCYSYYRECEYLGICTLKTENLTAPLDVEAVATKILGETFDIELSLMDLLTSQMSEV